ncbi:MAG: hypothetical protein ACLT98_00435 [Eggerthellaceae bacterium]
MVVGWGREVFGERGGDILAAPASCRTRHRAARPPLEDRNGGTSARRSWPRDIGEVAPGSPGTTNRIRRRRWDEARFAQDGLRLLDVATTSAVRVLASYSRTMCSMAQLYERRGEAAAEWILP